MQTDGRWPLAALTTALLVLYFTPWLALGYGIEPPGYRLSTELPALLQPNDPFGLGRYVSPLLGWGIPLIGLIGMIESACGKFSRWAVVFVLLVCALAGLELWLLPWATTPTLATLPLTATGFAVIACALLTLGMHALCAVHARFAHRFEPRLGITERRRSDGTVAIDVRSPRWQPLKRLLYIISNVAIVYVAATFWAHAHLLDFADRFTFPVSVGLLALISMTLCFVVCIALRYKPLGRIVIDRNSLRVIAGGDRGRYQRGHIGGLYVPQQSEDNVRGYYDEALDPNALTLPVQSQNADMPPSEALLRTPRTHVMMRLRHRTVSLAHHLNPAQAKELVRRVTIRLLD